MGWLPDHIWLAQKLLGKGAGGKGKGKSWGKSWSKGKGKGKSYLRVARAENKVWIGGLPAEGSKNIDLNKKLMEHMKQGGDCKFAEIKKGGMGGAVYKTAEEATAAIAALNGSTFEGSVVEVDVWEKKAKA